MRCVGVCLPLKISMHTADHARAVRVRVVLLPLCVAVSPLNEWMNEWMRSECTEYIIEMPPSKHHTEPSDEEHFNQLDSVIPVPVWIIFLIIFIYFHSCGRTSCWMQYNWNREWTDCECFCGAQYSTPSLLLTTYSMDILWIALYLLFTAAPAFTSDDYAGNNANKTVSPFDRYGKSVRLLKLSRAVLFRYWIVWRMSGGRGKVIKIAITPILYAPFSATALNHSTRLITQLYS